MKTKKITVKALDIMWSKIIHKKFDNRCAVCGATPCQAHHIFTRTYKSTRWDIENGIALCYKHHFFLAHSKFEEFRDFVIGFMGQEAYDKLKEKSKTIVKLDLMSVNEELSNIK